MSRVQAGLGLLLVLAMGCGSDPESARRPSTAGVGGSGAGGMYGNPTGGIGSNPGGASGAGLGGVSGAAGMGNECASVRVQASRVIPTVQLVIDGSGSMEDDFGNTTRWNAVRDALLSDTGVVQRLESVVEFGMSIYQTGDMNSCPELTGPAPAINNFMAISDAWLDRPNGSTPTAEAMEAVVASMTGTVAGPDQTYKPQIIILATDGAPNGCAGAQDWALFVGCLLNPMAPECAMLNMMLENDGYVRTLQAAKDAQAKGIDVYVLDLSEGGLNQQELQKVANVGVGLDENATPAAPLYVPSDPAALATALETIIGGAASCSLTLEGEIKNLDGACSAGMVEINGQAVTCGDTNGWRVVDSTHIELVGDACTTWLSTTDASLDARFPCDLVVVE